MLVFIWFRIINACDGDGDGEGAGVRGSIVFGVSRHTAYTAILGE